MSTNFKLYGNMPFSKDPFRRFSKTMAVASELILSTLGGILFMVDDFLVFMYLIFFTISHKETCLNENLF